MAQASSMDYGVTKAQIKEKWTMKKVFGTLAPIAAVVKTFNVFDTSISICLLILVFSIGYGEILNKGVSWQAYALAAFFAIVDLCQKNAKLKIPPLPKNKS